MSLPSAPGPRARNSVVCSTGEVEAGRGTSNRSLQAGQVSEASSGVGPESPGRVTLDLRALRYEVQVSVHFLTLEVGEKVWVALQHQCPDLREHKAYLLLR